MRTGLYEIVERGELKRILEEHDLQLTELADPAKAREIGRLARAEAVVVGEVFSYDTGMRFGICCWALQAAIRCVDVETGSVLWSCAISRGLANGHDDPAVAQVSAHEARGIAEQIQRRLTEAAGP